MDDRYKFQSRFLSWTLGLIVSAIIHTIQTLRSDCANVWAVVSDHKYYKYFLQAGIWGTGTFCDHREAWCTGSDYKFIIKVFFFQNRNNQREHHQQVHRQDVGCGSGRGERAFSRRLHAALQEEHKQVPHLLHQRQAPAGGGLSRRGSDGPPSPVLVQPGHVLFQDIALVPEENAQAHCRHGHQRRVHRQYLIWEFTIRVFLVCEESVL